MKTIYKYPLEKIEPGKVFSIDMPWCATVLSVQSQDGHSAVMWAKVNDSQEKEKKYFVWYMTGQEIEENNLNYIGTYQLSEVWPFPFVGHLFELKK